MLEFSDNPVFGDSSMELVNSVVLTSFNHYVLVGSQISPNILFLSYGNIVAEHFNSSLECLL